MNKIAEEHPRFARWIALLIFSVGLGLRLVRMDVPINVDEGLWLRRGPQFLAALLSGHPAQTYLRHHPGVPHLWLIGISLSLRYLARPLLPPHDLAHQSPSLLVYLQRLAGMEDPFPLALYLTARPLFALVTAATFTGFYGLAWRLFGGRVALLAALLLLGEPFYLAYQRCLTTDGLQANFTWLGLLAFLLHWRSSARADRWLVLSAFAFALALLSKVAALLFLPGFLLLAWFSRPGGRGGWRGVVASLALWLAVVLVTVLALWPAVWADPLGTWNRFANDLFGTELQGSNQFYLGRPTRTPGPLFYLVVLGYRGSPVLLVGVLMGVGMGLFPAWRRRLPSPSALAALALTLGGALLGLSLQATKIDRYLVPLFPGLALLAAAALSALPVPIALLRLRGPAWLLPVVLVGVLQGGMLLSSFPYYLTYYNPLLGGAARAVGLLMIGNGELLDQAAAWLNAHTDPQDTPVASWYSRSFGPYYRGPTWIFSKWPEADYAVLYINQIQRQEPSPDVIRYFEGQRPVHVIRYGGVEYVRIYRGPFTSIPTSSSR